MKTSFFVRIFALLSLLFFSQMAFAQQDTTGTAQSSERNAVLEEVMVTATRRGETDIQTTPISVSALNSESLDRLLMHDLGDIALAVPNLVAGNAPAFKSFNPSLRGVGKADIILYVESPVGVSVDDFVLPHVQTQALEPFDLEAVEVLRGPQGTLFGKNTTAGVINVRTKKPQLDSTSAEIKASYAEFDEVTTKYALNYGTSTFALRASGVYRKSDGYYKNGKQSTSFDPAAAFSTGDFSPVQYNGDGRDLGGDDVFSGRFKALWQPNENFRALFQYEIISDNGDSPPDVAENAPTSVFAAFLGFQGVTSGDPLDQAAVSDRDDFFSIESGHQVDVDGFYLNLDWTIGSFDIHSVTGYRDQKSRLANTYPGEVRTSLFDASRDDNRETFQQEIRFDSNFNGPFNFTAGGFYQNDDTRFCVTQILGLIDFFGPTATPLNNTLAGLGLPTFVDGTFNGNASVLCNQQDAESIAFFVDGSYTLTDRLTLSGGVRITDEDKKWAGRPQTFFQFLEGTSTANEGLFASLNEPLDASDFERFPFNVAREDGSWTEESWRATVGYEATDEVFLWTTRSHSFKSGAFNDQTGTFTAGLPFPFGNPLQLKPIDPEKVDSLEFGLKAELFNRRARFDVVYFDVDYDDAQRQLNATFPLPGGGSFQETLFFNAAKLNVKGVEFEGSALLIEGLTLNVNFSWQSANFEKFEADTDFDGVIDVDLSDKEVDRAPDWTATGSVNYTHRLFDLGTVSHNILVSYQDGTIFTYSDLGTQFDGRIDSRTLLNWSSTFTDKSGNYSVRVFGKNLTDVRYRTGNLAVANLWTMTNYGAPQQFGVEVGVRFDL